MDDSRRLLEALRADDSDGLGRMIDADPSVLGGSGREGVSTLLLAVYHGAASCIDEIRRRGHAMDCCEAAALGEVGRIRELVAAEPAAVATPAPDGWTPLHLAVFFGHAGAARALLDAGAAVSVRGANDALNTPLHAALAGRGDGACVDLLLAADADVRATDAAGFTPLHVAASRGSDRFCTRLLAAGGDPAARSRDGRTPADVATERGFPALSADLQKRAGKAR
jgi:uncharacterized protein